MIKKEILEIRRRFRIDRNAITRMRGCYVNSEKAVLATFNHMFGNIEEDERHKYLAIFSKTLSGTPGKNLIDIEFETENVANGEEHKLLMRLRDSRLEDSDAVETFFQTVINSLSFEGNYLILLIHEAYDVPFRGKDNRIFQEGSEEVYNYILCSVCPVTLSKPALSYFPDENTFRDRIPDWQVAVPELGFLFPAFDDRRTNIYNALYYLKNPEKKHDDFANAIFSNEVPPTSEDQKVMFHEVLADTLGEYLDYAVVQNMQEQIRERVEINKSIKDAEPLALSGRDISTILSECGVPEPAVADFEQEYEEKIGKEIEASNLVSTKLVIKTNDIVVNSKPERSDRFEVRTIDGRKYLLIPIEDSIEVNGINVNAL